MGVFCEPALWVELLTVRPCGEKEGRGTVKSSLFPQGLRPWRTQSTGACDHATGVYAYCSSRAADIMAKALNPFFGDGERSSSGRSRSGTPLPPLNTCSSSNQVRTIVR